MKGEIVYAQGALEDVSQNFGWGGEQGCRLVLAGIPYIFEPTPFYFSVENTWPRGLAVVCVRPPGRESESLVKDFLREMLTSTEV